MSIFATNDGYDDVIDLSTDGKISFPSEEILPEENTTLQTFPDYYDGVDFSTEPFSFPSEEDSSDTNVNPNPNTNNSSDQGDYIT